MTIGKKIKLCRKKKGLSQEDLANILGVSRQAVQKWEVGTSQPDLSNVILLSGVFNVSTDYLLKDSNEEVKNNNEEVEPIKETAKSINSHRIKVIKIWLIIGAALTPLVSCGSFLRNQYRPEAVFFLLLFLVTIPLCIIAINKCKKAKTHNELIAIGIISLIFVSVIGGILILSTSDNYFENCEATQTNSGGTKDEKVSTPEASNEEKVIIEEELTSNKKAESSQKIIDMYDDFSKKKYNPDDIAKASYKKSEYLTLIDNQTEEAELDNIVNEYFLFLNSFSIDEDYYIKKKQNRKKNIMRASIVLAVVSVTTVLGVGIGFIAKNISANVYYNSTYEKAVNCMNAGLYDEALSAFRSLDHSEAIDNKIKVCNGLISLSYIKGSSVAESIKTGINTVIKGNESVVIDYHSNFDNEITYREEINNLNYSFYTLNIEREGYAFSSWQLHSVQYQNKTYLELYAKWNKINYLINYNLNEGVNHKNNPNIYTIESSYTLFEPTRDGYDFVEWRDENDNIVEKIGPGQKGNIILKAKWQAKLNALTVKNNNSSLGNVEVIGQGFTDGSISIKATPTGDNVFFGWFDGNSIISKDNPYMFNMPTHDYELTAIFYTKEEVWEYSHAKYPIYNEDTNTIYYGFYPQSVISSAEMRSALNTSAILQDNGWYLYDDDYYVKMKGNPNGGYNYYHFNDGSLINKDSNYWFKVEPIEWMIVEVNDDVFLTSKLLIDTHIYDEEEPYYISSSIRDYLNNEFYNNAFLDNSYILKTIVDNSASTTSDKYNPFVSENTEDKVFLMSYADYPKNEKKGLIEFNNDVSNTICLTSEYARAKGASTIIRGANLHAASYWTRSPLNKSFVWHQTSSGNVLNGGSIDDTGTCVRPCIKISRDSINNPNL